MMNTFRYVYEIVAQLIQQIMLESPEQSTDQPTNKFLVLYLTYNITSEYFTYYRVADNDIMHNMPLHQRNPPTYTEFAMYFSMTTPTISNPFSLLYLCINLCSCHSLQSSQSVNSKVSI